ncbi:pectate lyase [Lacihabitans sp. LS3-19]|uniref:pectate lyase n=1 Tax=Lacihabitans sp. LS3-19 TaxID=2487335 RepID=UPI0020CFA8EF|nr:pectate lyase [Lacihabitans sp. LS3-19]MCP9770431.1 pectate lyase [Lacihabitans sp. LS3-19]
MKNQTLKLSLGALLFIGFSIYKSNAQNQSYVSKPWKEVATQMPSEWYGSDESKMAADSVLKYQTPIGGWMKNSGFHNGGVKQDEWERILSSGIGATFDNDATITEIRFLAKMYAKTKDPKYKKAFNNGLAYIFISQYENGGWPQFYPVRKGNVSYSGHITYNDDAMVNIMTFLEEIATNNPEFVALEVSEANKKKAKKAIQNGIQCFLDTQIIVNGKPSVWCAQHDESTLLPAKARSYELASFSGGESVGITLYLMGIKNPSTKIKNSINGAVEWFETHKIEGIRLDAEITKEGTKNRIVVEDKNAPTLWARFYDLETEKPIFCDRDGIKKSSLAEIGDNRRNGYSWYGTGPSKVLKQYPNWLKENH